MLVSTGFVYVVYPITRYILKCNQTAKTIHSLYKNCSVRGSFISLYILSVLSVGEIPSMNLPRPWLTNRGWLVFCNYTYQVWLWSEFFLSFFNTFDLFCSLLLYFCMYSDSWFAVTLFRFENYNFVYLCTVPSIRTINLNCLITIE